MHVNYTIIFTGSQNHATCIVLHDFKHLQVTLASMAIDDVSIIKVG